MSKKFKEHYTAYQREILQEFISEEELNEMDRKYTEAKFRRMVRKVENQVSAIKAMKVSELLNKSRTK